jgi:5'-3' exonuclease
MLDPERLAMVTGVRPEQYLDLAALRGDSSDNLPGVPGFGAKTAVKLLQALGSGQAAFDDAANGGERCRAAIGNARAKGLATAEAKERWLFNREVMAMVTTAELGFSLVDGAVTGAGRLPLDEDRVRDTYSRFELHAAGAIRALTLREPSRVVTMPIVEPRWTAPPSQRRHGPLPQLVPTLAGGPAYVQETLF